MIFYNPNGTTTLVDDANPARTQTLAANLTREQRDAAIVTFHGAYVPTEQNGFDRITPRQLMVSILAEFRRENLITAAQQDAMRDGALERLKR